MPWVRRICSVSETGVSLRDQPASPRIGLPPLSRLPAGGGPKSQGFVHDSGGIYTLAGFRRKTEDSRIRPGMTRFGSSTFSGWCALLRSVLLALRRRIAFAFPQPGRPVLQPLRVNLRAVLAFLPRLSPPRPADRLNPPERQNRPSGGTALHPRPFRAGAKQETLRSSPTGFLVPFRIPDRRFLSVASAGPSRGGLRPSLIHEAGCPISPSSRSELASR